MHNKDASLEMDKNRTKEFEKNTSLEQVLSEINNGISDSISPSYEKPKYPVILVMGAPRSGTTLTLQWLASTGLFAYPTNISARFYANPYLGARVQQALSDYDTDNQIGLKPTFNFQSNLGRSMGGLAPSEFWYFWRQFFKFGEVQKMTRQELGQVDTKNFIKGLAGLEAAFDKPVVLKGMMLNWHIPFLNDILENVIFLNVERDSFYNAQSILQARLKFFGTEERWYSFKPPEYETLQKSDPTTQIAGQVHHTKRAVREGLLTLPENRFLTINYEEFCQNPASVFSKLQKKLMNSGYKITDNYSGAKKFDVTNITRLDPDTAEKLRSDLQRFEGT